MSGGGGGGVCVNVCEHVRTVRACGLCVRACTRAHNKRAAGQGVDGRWSATADKESLDKAGLLLELRLQRRLSLARHPQRLALAAQK